jgi:small subunit ribosomal protein S21
LLEKNFYFYYISTFNFLSNSILFVKGANLLKEITVRVDDNDLEKAMRILKKKIQNDGLFKRLKLKKNYEKPSEYRRRKKREALRRQRIADSKRNMRYRRY